MDIKSLITNMDKKTKSYIIIGASCILLLFVLLLIFKIIAGSRITPQVLETRLKSAAESYYKDNKDMLPENGKSTNVSIETLVSNGNIKSMDKLLKKGYTCSGSVNVQNNNGYYLYTPNIDCGDDYKTSFLYNKIIDESNIVTTGNGLYKFNDYYLYRGENLNNYVSFAGKTWQILRVNSDNTIRMILIDKLDSVAWDDRYNSDRQDSSGKNTYEISRIKDTLEEYFKSDIFKDSERALIVPQSLCIGKRNEESTEKDGSIECSSKYDNQPLGLIQANEVALASLESKCSKVYSNECTNYNFISDINGTFWSITADSASTHKVYKVSGTAFLSTASSYAQPKFVINLSSDAIYSKGDGSVDNPYVVK